LLNISTTTNILVIIGEREKKDYVAVEQRYFKNKIPVVILFWLSLAKFFVR
jgi:hypothetical protein